MAVLGNPDDLNTGSFDQILETTSHAGAEFVLPQGGDLGGADYNRLGEDLLLTFPDGETTLLSGFFQNSDIEHLVGAEGVRIPANIIDILAGSKAPGQFAQAAPGATAEPIGVVETEEGSVFAVRADGSRDELNSGDPIFQGDTLETGADGLLKIAFIDESTLSMDEGSRLVVDEMIFDPGTQDGNGVLFALQGTMNFISGGIAKVGPESMLINTPVATIGIRGTSVLIYLKPPENPNEQPELTVVLGPEINPDGTDGFGEIYVITNVGQITLNQPFDSSRVESIDQIPADTGTMSLQEAVRVYGDVLLTSSNNISPEFRETIEKVVDQIEAEDERIEKEIELNEILDQQQSTQIAALAKAEELILAQSDFQNLTLELNESLQIGAATAIIDDLRAQLAEAQFLINSLEGEAGDLQTLLEEITNRLTEAQQAVDDATSDYQSAAQQAQDAIEAYADNFDGEIVLSGLTNITGENDPFQTASGEENEFTLTDDEELELNDGEESSSTGDVLNNFEDTEDPTSFSFTTPTSEAPEVEQSSEQAEETSSSGITQNALTWKPADPTYDDSVPESYGPTLGRTGSVFGPRGEDIFTYTFEAWIKLEANVANSRHIISFREVSDRFFDFYVIHNGGPMANEYRLEISGDDGNNGTTTITGDKTLNADTWYHVAVVTSDGYQKLYVDGQLDKSESNAYPFWFNNTIDQAVNVGQNKNGIARGVEEIAEVRMWKSDQSSEFDNSTYINTQVNPAGTDKSDLIAYASFDESDQSEIYFDLYLNGSSTPTNQNIGSTYHWSTNGPSLNEPGTDPIVIDLNGDGIEFVGLDAGISFDTDVDGKLEATGWFGENDGLLVADLNEDGVINNMTEVVSHFFNYQGRNDEGLLFSSDVLALYDDNKDNLINSQDEIFEVLRIWQDANQNGQTDTGELLGLSDHGILSISLNSMKQNTLKQGNLITEEGEATFIDGSKHIWNEVLFELGKDDTSYSSNNQNDETSPSQPDIMA